MYDNLKRVKIQFLEEFKTEVLKHEIKFEKFEVTKATYNTKTKEVFKLIGDEEVHINKNFIIGVGKDINII